MGRPLRIDIAVERGAYTPSSGLFSFLFTVLWLFSRGCFYEIFAVSCYQLFSMAIILSIAQEGQRFFQEVCSKVRQHCVY